MVILIIIFVVLILCIFTEESDFDKMKNAEKLPPFTKEEAYNYYKYLLSKNKKKDDKDK